jgi:acetyl-CoA acetyltransferase
MARVAVAGVGMAPFGRHPERSATSLGVEAVDQALADAGLAWRDVQTMYCGVLLLGLTPGTRISEEMGFTGIPVVNIDNASASGSSAFREAYLAVATEQVDVALAVGVGKAEGLRNAAGSFPKPGTEAHKQAQFLRMQGLFAPMGIFAMRTRRRMHDYGSRIEQLAMVAVKNRKHASLNPYAQLRKPQTLEDVMNARMVCDPLTVPHCCPIGDGASAAIVVSEKKARELGLSPMVTVEASVFRSPASSGGTTSQDSDTTARTAREAYEQAGMGPEDISLVQVHDAFTIEEVDYCEAMGFCPEGEGERWVEAGELGIGGRIPFSTDGGLLSRGHPNGPTGLAQIWETTQQLRGQSEQRQVAGATAGLTHMVGVGGVCVVHILKRN